MTTPTHHQFARGLDPAKQVALAFLAQTTAYQAEILANATRGECFERPLCEMPKAATNNMAASLLAALRHLPVWYYTAKRHLLIDAGGVATGATPAQWGKAAFDFMNEQEPVAEAEEPDADVPGQLPLVVLGQGEYERAIGGGA